MRNLRYLHFNFRYLITFLFVFHLGCGSSDTSNPPPQEPQKAKNIILLIGDGMGDEHRKAASFFAYGSFDKLTMDSLPQKGTVTTHSANNAITDSAAAATAMATGVKTSNGVIGMDSDLRPLVTILEEAKMAGKSVGLVTTTQISHATPAAFASHVSNRDMMTEIASQYLTTEVDLLLGGGEDEFLPSGEIGC